MKKMNFSKKKFGNSSKGFYVAAAICLVGAGAATWLAVDRTITGIERNNSQIIEDENRFSDFPSAEETEQNVEQKTSGIPIEKPESSAQPSSSSTSSSSSAPASKPAIKSEQSAVSEKLPTLAYSPPINGNIINQYSNGELIKNITLGDWRTHDAVDFAANKGEDVFAVADGVVAEVRNDALWGTIITIDHPDGRQSIYSGLSSSVPVAAGDSVTAKQAIGKVDGVPCEISDESHLHFAMRQDGKWIDPLPVIQ